jgi:hypothetical protein
VAVVPENGRDLISWKEIAEYLRVTVRAAQKWERERGLPVRRLPGKRSMVSASRDELNSWRKLPDRPGDTARRARHWRGLYLVILGVSLFAAAACLFFAIRRSAPVAFRVDQGSLVVLDEHGHELWQRVFDDPLLTEAYATDAYYGHRRFWVGDLDGDGHKEVLFVVRTLHEAWGADYLACFSDRGVERWRFVPGRKISSASETFANRYVVRDFAVAPLGHGGAPEILVTSSQIPYYPDQVALLSSAGKILGEYWHSGNLEYLVVSGRDIYLGGISNGYRAATLVVLDADHISGVSTEEDAAHQLLGFAPAHEKARILFAKSCISRKFEPYNRVTNLVVDRNAVTVLVSERPPPTPATVWYHFTPDLKLSHFEFTDLFRAYHAELRARHELDHDLTPGEEARLQAIRVLSNQFK